VNRLLLIARSVRYYWRPHLGTVAGAAVTAAALVGGLVIGDCVRGTLRDQATARIGQIDSALQSGDRFFRAALADDLNGVTDAESIAPVIALRAVASTADSSARANDVRAYGVDDRFFAMSPEHETAPPIGAEEVLLNQRLADQLNAAVGDMILIRIEKPSALPREAVLARPEDGTLGLRVRVKGVLSDEQFGRFSPTANQLPAMNTFLSREWLAEELELAGLANMLLVQGKVLALHENVNAVWTLDDAELELRTNPDLGYAELRSRRIFLDPAVTNAVDASAFEVQRILTYFVTSIAREDRATPYSMVSAIGGRHVEDGIASLIPDSPDGIILNEWLADDLSASIGDRVDLHYFVFDEERRLVDRSHTFEVERIVPIEGFAADRSLMPDFPGIAEAERSRVWEPGIPIDLSRIRDKDEAYWETRRGTPKAFIALETGQQLWSNRFGNLTAVRVPIGRGEAFASAALEHLEPRAVGLSFEDLSARAVAGSAVANDFGMLFLSLSGFLLISAILLTVLLFILNVEQRAREIGTLLAVGFPPGVVRRMLTLEAAALAIIGAVIGGALGLLYTRLILTALGTIWADAAAGTVIAFHARPTSIIGGIAGAAIASILATWFAVRFQVKRRAVELLKGLTSRLTKDRRRGRATGLIVGAIAILAGVILAFIGSFGSEQRATPFFFASGSLLLIGGILLSRSALFRLGSASSPEHLSIASLGMRNVARRAGRSLATIILLACGVFLIVAVGMNRLDAAADASIRSSGTGGFAFYATTAIPIPRDLTTSDARASLGLDSQEFEDVSFVPFRVRAGDDASCLNLGLAQRPQLIAVDPSELAQRDAFSFAGATELPGAENPWLSLRSEPESESNVPTIPAIGDHQSVTWALHKSIGDTIEYIDERGRPFHVRIVATIKNSILQGSLIIDAARFEELFPSETGYRLFLIDAPRAAEASSLREDLSRRFADYGLEITPAAQRLNDFNAVQNTYLAIFQLLGGLGLLLGTAGLGVVVLRNVLERRSELAVLASIGFRPGVIRGMVVCEHLPLLGLGVMCGGLSAAVAAAPALHSGAAAGSIGVTVAIVLAILAAGIVWISLATRVASRGRLTSALRHE